MTVEAIEPSDDIGFTDILGVHISALTMRMAVETIERWIDRREKHYICICTVHSVMEADRDPAYKDVLNNAGLATPDGMPLVWLSRRSGKQYVERVAGPDLMPELLSRSGLTGHRHFFYGGNPGVVEELADRMKRQFPDICIAGIHTPGRLAQGEVESSVVINTINASGADVVWVGLGAPKQDFWLRDHQDLLKAPVLIGVGAAFDFHSGRVKRAPIWMQETGFEWLYRLSRDPRRLLRRYATTNLSFLYSILFGTRSNRRH